MRHALEDASVRKFRLHAEPLAAELRRGVNYLDPSEFLLMVQFFDDCIDDPEEALRAGKVRILGTFTLHRVPVGSLVSLTQIASMGGVSRSTAARWVNSSKVPFSVRGRKKLYNVHGLQIKVS